MDNNKLNHLLNVLECQYCEGTYSYKSDSSIFVCNTCGQSVSGKDGKPIFIEIASNVHVFEKRVRGPKMGTPWRQANWKFLKEEIDKLPSDALVLDVGSGRGDFREILKNRDCITLDIYPYPEIDIVADLTRYTPFKPNSFDMVVLMNVLEHVFDTDTLLKEIRHILKPGGLFVIAVPFLLKVHQAPIDFVRYTEYALHRWADKINLEVALLEGYYDPVFLLEQGIGNIRFGVLPRLRRIKRYLVQLMIMIMSMLGKLVQVLLGNGYTRKPENEISPAPFGYHMVLTKPYE